MRQPVLGECAVEPDPRGASLLAEEHRAEDRVGQEEDERRDQADRLADLDDHVELRDRDEDEDHNQEQHGPEG